MSEKSIMAVWIGIFLTVSTISWAIAFTFVYGPPSPPAMKAIEICAINSSARISTFCMEIAKK